MLGGSRTVVSADHDGLDNDNDGRIDELNEMKSKIDEVLAVAYPELGVHLWFNGNWRTSVFGKYLFTNLGDQKDDWLIGGQLTYYYRPGLSK